MFRLLNVKWPPLPPRLRLGEREGPILFNMVLYLCILGYLSHFISFLLYMFRLLNVKRPHTLFGAVFIYTGVSYP